MANSLSEAGKVYLENYAALREAESQMSDFLTAVWDSLWTSLEEAWKLEQEESEAPPLVPYPRKTNPGKWEIGLQHQEAPSMYACVVDPRRTGDPTLYRIVISMTKQENRAIEKQGEELSARLQALAQDNDTPLNWERPRKMWVEAVQMRPESAEETAEALLEPTHRAARTVWQMARLRMRSDTSE